MYAAHLSSASVAWVVGASGTILKTSNGGTAWVDANNGGASIFSVMVILMMVNGDRIIVHKTTKTICLDAKTGATIWENEAYSILLNSTYSIGIGYLKQKQSNEGSNDDLCGFDLNSGKQIWKRKIGHDYVQFKHYTLSKFGNKIFSVSYRSIWILNMERITN